MRAYSCQLIAPAKIVQLQNIRSFIGRDQSGSFAILAGRRDFLTVLEYGVCTINDVEDRPCYFGLAGGVLSFKYGKLNIVTSFFIQSYKLQELDRIFKNAIAKEQTRIEKISGHIRKLDNELIRRIREVAIDSL